MLRGVKEFMLLPIIRHKKIKSKIIPTDLLTAPHYALKIDLNAIDGEKFLLLKLFFMKE
jgi:hypothetical protein